MLSSSRKPKGRSQEPAKPGRLILRAIFSAFIAIALCACARLLPSSGAPYQVSSPDQPLAIAIEDAVERASTERSAVETLWPGFDPLLVPLAIYDGQKTYLFRHPTPPEPFVPVNQPDSRVLVMDGRHENVTANTNSEIGGVPTATLLLDPTLPQGSANALAAVAIHEAFHVYQREHHPGWIGNEADLFTYPTDSTDLLALRRQESHALRNALQSEDPQARACWTRSAMSLRAQRYAQMDPRFAAYERGTELNEGLATYVQMRVEGKASVAIPDGDFKPSAIRQRAYATGPALALLLDRVDPGWNPSFEADDKQTLDEALSRAVGKGDICSLEPNVVAATEIQAGEDIAALVEERTRLLSDFEALPGWRIIVNAPADSPLWPQGFDPINVERLSKAQVLHTRFVTLGNDLGQIEVLNARTLTQGMGEHPLFNGIDRMEVGGLEEPRVVSSGTSIEVVAPGLSAKFKSATATTTGSVVTVQLGK